VAEPFIGQVIAVGFPFVPVGWLPCDGSLQQISQYDVLYSLIGTTYGGNGTTDFALPDLRGRSPLGAGQGSGLPNYVQGQPAGTENVTIIANQVGAHSHNLMASSQNGAAINPATNLAIGQNPLSQVQVYGPPPSTVSLAGTSIGTSTAGGQPHENRQPFIAINYIICAFGVYPSRG
jgi:microcystin-dependent protein